MLILLAPPVRRVEKLMRPAMSTALKTARRSNQSNKLAKPPTTAEEEADGLDNSTKKPSGIDPHASTKERPTEFAPRPTSFSLHLHDVAMEPPSLHLATKNAKRKRGLEDVDGGGVGDRLGLSRAQKRILEEEREKVIRRYREMKAEQASSKGNA